MSVLAYSLDKYSAHRDRMAIIPEIFANDPTLFPNGSLSVVSAKLGWKIKAMPFIDISKRARLAHPGYANVMNKLWIW